MNLETLKLNELQRVWKKISKESVAPDYTFEIENHQRLLHFFQIGDYYFYIFNYTTSEIEHLSSSLSDILGYHPAMVNIQFLLDIIHPDDLPYVMSIEHTISNFFDQLPTDKVLKYKVRYDYRIRKSTGEFIRVLQQVIPIQADSQGAIQRTLSIHTDISHLKDSGKPILSFIGLDGEPSYVNQEISDLFLPSRELLSKREKEVLTAMMEGSQSKDIACKLGIAKETVDRHRKNMLIKTAARSTAELVALAIREGWV